MRRLLMRFGARHNPRSRLYSTSSKPTSTAPSSSSPEGASVPPRARPAALDRLRARLPPRLRGYLDPLLESPLSHTTSFLVLHEVTAVVPLLGIAALLHWTDSTWSDSLRARVEGSGAFREGAARWDRYLRRKGWIDGGAAVGGHEAELAGSVAVGAVATSTGAADVEADAVVPADSAGGGGGQPARLVVELATAWAITKLLLPARIAVSVWATPWFARVAVVPLSKFASRVFRRA